MAYQKNYKMVSPEEIRSSSISYEQLLMRCLDRMDVVLTDCSKEKKFLPIDAKVRLIDAILFPVQEAKYIEKRRQIEKTLEEIGEWNYEYFKQLMEWVKLIASKFNELEILPERKVTWIAGLGPAHEHPEFFKGAFDKEEEND